MDQGAIVAIVAIVFGCLYGMVYLAGKVDHKLGDEDMVEHIAGLVEQKAAEIEAKKAAAAPEFVHAG